VHTVAMAEGGSDPKQCGTDGHRHFSDEGETATADRALEGKSAWSAAPLVGPQRSRCGRDQSA